MKINYLATLIFSIVIFSCNQEKIDDNIYWVESNAICVHWSDFGKKNFEEKAIRIVLKSSDPKIFEEKAFYLNTTVVEEKHFLLGRVQKIEKTENHYFLFLFIRSEDLYDLFPKGKNNYNDNCYHIELANMIGQGQVLMRNKEKETKVEKSGDYSFHIGPK